MNMVGFKSTRIQIWFTYLFIFFCLYEQLWGISKYVTRLREDTLGKHSSEAKDGKGSNQSFLGTILAFTSWNLKNTLENASEDSL